MDFRGMRNDRATRARGGMTLVELALVLVIISILAGAATFSLQDWARNLRARDAARDMADILHIGRAEAIRTGTPHVVFFATDTAGNPLLGEDGATRVWAVVISDDDGDLQIDGGELRHTVPMPPAGSNLSFGRTAGRGLIPRNVGALMGDPFWNTGVEGTAEETNTPANFRNPDDVNDVQNWVLFEPDGTPRAARSDGMGGTITGSIGSGDGAVYITNGDREYAIVMAPLGGIRMFQYDQDAAQWR